MAPIRHSSLCALLSSGAFGYDSFGLDVGSAPASTSSSLGGLEDQRLLPELRTCKSQRAGSNKEEEEDKTGTREPASHFGLTAKMRIFSALFASLALTRLCWSQKLPRSRWQNVGLNLILLHHLPLNWTLSERSSRVRVNGSST